MDFSWCFEQDILYRRKFTPAWPVRFHSIVQWVLVRPSLVSVHFDLAAADWILFSYFHNRHTQSSRHRRLVLDNLIFNLESLECIGYVHLLSGNMMYLISLKWNLISRILNLWIRGGSLSSVWVFSSDTRGLWSVSATADFPTTNSHDRSHTHMRARASFSICARIWFR